MSSQIHTTIAPSVYAKCGALQSIEATIASIRDGKHADLVERIRKSKDKDERQRLKCNTLPVFYPTVRLGPECRLDESSEPTGIIQFDIDKKDNPNLEMQSLKSRVVEHPSCVYAFGSPSGGVKFGIVTDFTRPTDESIEVTRQRFKMAYRRCLEEIQNYCGHLHFRADSAAARIRQSCLLSHDANAFVRSDSSPLLLNDQCQMPVGSTLSVETNADTATVQYVLSHIPADLSYDDRFKINACVLFLLGRAGISLLMSHWTTDRSKLESDLDDCLKRAEYGTLGQLQRYAEQYGDYKRSTGGHSRNKVRPMQFDHVLEPLATPEEATVKLQRIVREFVNGKTSDFVNVTAGAGKTRAVLEMLSREVSWMTKILFLAPTHSLAAEVVQTFNEIRRADIASTTELKDKLQRPSIIHLHSRKTLCQNVNARTNLEEKGVNIPFEYCTSHCGFRGDCNYTDQFNSMANIRVMTHNEWFNEQSAWFNGHKQGTGDYVAPIRDRRWVPEYIIIDEDILKFGDVVTEPSLARFPSVAAIITGVQAGLSLRDAIWTNREQVLADATDNREPQNPSSDLSPAEYAAEVQRRRRENQYSKVFARIESYCRHDDPKLLDGIWVDENVIRWLPLPRPAERYRNIPTLYLDATANPAVVQKCLPNVQFHRISVRQHDDVRLLQCSNKTITKKWLKEPCQLDILARGLTDIAKSYAQVGLITYKSINGDDKFAQHLAERVGAQAWAHFGNLRGLNAMQDIDCLLIVGRHMLRTGTMQEIARGVFNSHQQWGAVYADLPVRMKDGSTLLLNVQAISDRDHQAIYEHTSRSETLQAIGRGRLVHGPQKDVYVFANESLTTDVEVAEFFAFEDYFESARSSRKKASLVSEEALQRVKERGFIQLKSSDLCEQLGLTASVVKSSEAKDRIVDELVATGAFKIETTIQYRKGGKGPRTYAVFDMDKLQKTLACHGEAMLD